MHPARALALRHGSGKTRFLNQKPRLGSESSSVGSGSVDSDSLPPPLPPPLRRGLTNEDLSRPEGEALNAPWHEGKGRSAFATVKSSAIRRGLKVAHMFAVVALLGVGLMVGSLFVGPASGLLEIGVSIILFSIFCLLFVRCDSSGEEEDYLAHKGANNNNSNSEVPPLTDVIVEAQPESKFPSEVGKIIGDSDSSSCETLGSGSDASLISSSSTGGSRMTLLLTRSNPRKIPSPLRVFGYELNFSPIPECSEPSSSAHSSFLGMMGLSSGGGGGGGGGGGTSTYRSSFVSSRSGLAHSSTGDSLSRVSSKTSTSGGPGDHVIIEEEDDYEDGGGGGPLRFKLDLLRRDASCDDDEDALLLQEMELGDRRPSSSSGGMRRSGESASCAISLLGGSESVYNAISGDLDFLSNSNSNLSIHSTAVGGGGAVTNTNNLNASFEFDTEDSSMTSNDLSGVTVIDRSGGSGSASRHLHSDSSPSTRNNGGGASCSTMVRIMYTKYDDEGTIAILN